MLSSLLVSTMPLSVSFTSQEWEIALIIESFDIWYGDVPYMLCPPWYVWGRKVTVILRAD